MSDLSEYSVHFTKVGEAEYQAARDELERGYEKLRTGRDLAVLRRFLRGPRVLDFPIGTARLFPHLLGDYEIFGKDISPLYVQKAKSDFPQIADRFSVGSFEAPGEGGPFDSIYSMRVINNVKDFELAVKNIAGLLTKNGLWLVSMPPAKAEAAATRETLARQGLVIDRVVTYDWMASFKAMTYAERKLRALWVKLAARGLAPHWLHVVLDKLMPRKGTALVVARRKD